MVRLILFCLCCLSSLFAKGFVEPLGPWKALHLEGSAYERGYQHGHFLKEQILENIAVISSPALREHPQFVEFEQALPKMVSHIESDHMLEMQGLADGAGVSLDEIVLLNCFPEAFHCSAVTAADKASVDGSLYHLRVLDYGVGKGLVPSFVFIIAHPEGKTPYCSLSYAGFIGVISGMNQAKISVGELGDRGYGQYHGMPMPLILKKVCEETTSLEQIQTLLEKTARTCSYYYVFGDGKTQKACAALANPTSINWIYPGESYTVQTKEGEQTRFQPEGCLVFARAFYDDQFQSLQERVVQGYGVIDTQALQAFCAPPVTNETNLHNVVFHPSSLTISFSHASFENFASLEPYFTSCLEASFQNPELALNGSWSPAHNIAKLAK